MKLHHCFYSILSGLLLFVAWPVSAATFCIFFAFVPLLLLFDKVTQPNYFFGYAFVSMLIWNVGTTWWIWNSTDVGSVAAIVANSLLMCLPWWGFYRVKQLLGKPLQYVALLCFWMLFEYIHLNWQLSWPWLTIGNVFAAQPMWVQWYEFTGVGGGTLWVLLVNITIKLAIDAKLNNTEKKYFIRYLVAITSLVLLPLAVSFAVQSAAENLLPTTAKKSNIVVVQPNIDPYQKFESNSIPEQINRFIAISEQNIDSETQLVLWPETALGAFDEELNTINNAYYKPVFAFVKRHPALTLVSGIEMYKNYGFNKATLTAHKRPDGTFYDALNAAVCIPQPPQPLQFYYKSKLVPGVESLPTFLNFLAPVFEQFGGTTGGYGKDTSAKAFFISNNQYVPAPIICYESIYGQHVANYVQKGANVLTILTNDGWWGNTPGHKQHLDYACLRAIETRRWVARSANTGISAIIDAMGQIRAKQPWNVAAAIKYQVPINSGITVYVHFGDYLYYFFSVLAVLLICWCMFSMIRESMFNN